MKKLISLAVFSALCLHAQSFRGPVNFYGPLDASGAAASKPFKVGPSLPATCGQGEAFFLTTAAAGANYYGCTVTNTWTAQSGTTGSPTNYTFNSPFQTSGSTISLLAASASQNGYLSSTDWTRFDAAATGTDLFAGPYVLKRVNSYAPLYSHGQPAMTQEFFVGDGDMQYANYKGKVAGKNWQFTWVGGGSNTQTLDNVGDKYTFQDITINADHGAAGQSGMVALQGNHYTIGDFQTIEKVISQFGRAVAAGDEGLTGERDDFRDGQGNPGDWQVAITGVAKSTCAATQTTGGLAFATVDLNHTGSGYTSAPTVTISGGGGSGATATATILNGSVASITLTAPGSGYTSLPTITLSGGGGSGAQGLVYLLGYVPAISSTNPKGAEIIGIAVDSATNCGVGDWMYLGDPGAATIPANPGTGWYGLAKPVKITSVDTAHNVLYAIVRGQSYPAGTKLAPATVLSGSFGRKWGGGRYVMNWSKAVDGGTVTAVNGSKTITRTAGGSAYSSTIVGGSGSTSGNIAANVGCVGLQGMGNGSLLAWYPLVSVTDTTHLLSSVAPARVDGYDLPASPAKIAPCSIMDAAEVDYSPAAPETPNITKIILQPDQFSNWTVGDTAEQEVSFWNGGPADTNFAFSHVVTLYLAPGKEEMGDIVKNQGNFAPIQYAGKRLTASSYPNEIGYYNPFAIDSTMAGSAYAVSGRIRSTPAWQFPSYADMPTYPDATMNLLDRITGQTISTHMGRDGKSLRWHDQSNRYMQFQQYPETGDVILHRGQGSYGTTDNWIFRVRQDTGQTQGFGRISATYSSGGQMDDTDRNVEIAMHVAGPLAAGQPMSSATVDATPGLTVLDTRGSGTPSNTYVSLSSITPGNPTRLSVPGHGISPLKTVSVLITNGTDNWAALNGVRVLTVVDANTLSVPVDSTSFGSVTGPPQTYIPHTAMRLDAPGSVEEIEGRDVPQSTDPGCTATGHIGKRWFDNTTNTTVFKVCVATAGTVGWKTATLQ